MAYWSEDEKERVRRYLGESVKWLPVGYNKSSGFSTHIERVDIENHELILGYNEGVNRYVAWNALLHRNKESQYQTHTVGVPRKYVRPYNRTQIYNIAPIYRYLQGDGNHEKIVVIEPNFLPEFCENPFSYLLPDPSDAGYKKNTLYASPACPEPRIWREISGIELLETARERYSCTRAIREAHFRDRVFQKYSPPHCEICGITLEPILEAAHIVAVKDKGSDATENGMCLCRNHHRMYDKGLIHIDIHSKTFVIKNQKVATYMGLEVGQKYSLK